MSRQGPLRKNDIKRFEFDGYELTSGDLVEVNIAGHWILVRTEYGVGGYYFVTADGGGFIPCEGTLARLPERRT